MTQGSPIIYHLSDLHIRSGDEVKCRYQEYKYIFKNFVHHIKNDGRDAITIITGDIFHNKSKIESPGISLFYKFLKQVTKYTPVYIIRGNHDYKQWESNEVDLISSMLLPEIERVTYLNSTGTYNLTKDIGVGVLAIQDVIKAGASSATIKADKQIPFPKAEELETKYKIALFHGCVDNNRMFEGYDVAMLGDIHIQIVNGLGMKSIYTAPPSKEDEVRVISQHSWKGVQCPWGYAGSMIRQNVSESIEGHGFLCWDFENEIVTGYHINNVVDLAASECESDMFQGHSSINEKDKTKTNSAAAGAATPCILQNTPEMWAKYIEENGKVKNSNMLVANPDLLRLENIEENEVIKNKIQERNLKIDKKLDAYIDSMATGNLCNKQPFRLLKMTWDWILCYGADNQFYFNKLDGNVSTISGRNGHGKTSFLEIILLALYGQGFTSRNNKNNTNSIISIHKPSNVASQVAITFQIDTVGMFKVSRAFHPNIKPVPSSSKHILLEKWDSETSKWANIATGRLSVDKWIDSNIGPINSFLLSCMVSQNADYDFFAMNPMDQKEMLDNALCIDTHSRYMELLKESRLGYHAISELISYSLSTISKQLHENMSTHLDRIQIIDNQIVETRNNVPFIGEIREREYYENIVTSNENAKNRKVEDIIYEIEDIKRANLRGSIIKQTFDKPIQWYEEQLENLLLVVPSTSKKQTVIYNEENFDKLYTIVKFFDKDTGFDKGPYNNECDCCVVRKNALDSRKVYDEYVDQWWAKRALLETAIASIKYNKLHILQLELSDCKSREKALANAREILASYDDIITANKMTKLQIERARLVQEYESYQRTLKEKECYTDIYKRLQDRLNDILDVNSCLENYINWLYKKNVIPLVEKYTNEIMNLIDPELKLKGRLNEGKGFEWSITTTTSTNVSSQPTIEKASGFQRFICGLAIRIALGTIGASGIKPRQLFLDEGFTSCDSVNLAKVPNFLSMLLNLYDSILLVTHLEDLKDFCVDSTIQIVRDIENGTSQLR